MVRHNVRHNVVVIREVFVANSSWQIAHFLSCSIIFRFSSFRISAGDLNYPKFPWVMRIFNSVHAYPYYAFLPDGLPTTARA